MAKISTDAEINSVRLKEQASAPDTPASGYFQVYVKTDGKLYYKDDAGTEVCLSDKMTNPMTTAGDIIYGGASGAPARLAAGTEDYVLTMGATNPEWAEATGGSGLAVNGWEAADAMTYASADDPTFTVTITGDQSAKYSAGMRIKLTQSTGGTKYFIITKIAVSGDTTLTLYGGTDYNLENEAISNPYYSVVKAPQGFPLSPVKWTVEVTDTGNGGNFWEQSSPQANTWYNLGTITISIPVGIWRVKYKASPQIYKASANVGIFITLSTANNSQSDVDFTSYLGGYQAMGAMCTVEKHLVLDAKTSYYLNEMIEGTDTTSSLRLRSDKAKTIIRAECAYL